MGLGPNWEGQGGQPPSHAMPFHSSGFLFPKSLQNCRATALCLHLHPSEKEHSDTFFMTSPRLGSVGASAFFELGKAPAPYPFEEAPNDPFPMRTNSVPSGG